MILRMSLGVWPANRKLPLPPCCLVLLIVHRLFCVMIRHWAGVIMSSDRANLYEMVGSLPTAGDTHRAEARVRSSGARVILHRIEVDDPGALDVISGPLQRFAAIRDPRIPRVIDAWQTDNYIFYVTLEYFGEPLRSPASRHIFKGRNQNFIFQAAYQTLSALAALHDQVTTHRNVNVDCFLVTKTGLIFMQNHGLAFRVSRMVAVTSSLKSPDGILLASNLMGFDVADWAAMIASMVAGVPILDPSLFIDSSPVPEQVSLAAKQIKQLVIDKTLADFLVRALQARANETGGFENAVEALAEFNKVIKP